MPTIRIAAALIDDGEGRTLLVRKANTQFFMQAGGKLEPGETALAALLRELKEEIGLDLGGQAPRHLGCFVAEAANESGHLVEAELFHVRTAHQPQASAEIEETLWVELDRADQLLLAPLT
jgi:8-oxo-dGTP diphosphatase